MSDSKIFIREHDVEVVNETLNLHQKFEGDVSCVVWDASIVLAKYLEELYKKGENFKSQRVVELGAGLGCVGLTAACLGADVVLTDLPEALPLLEINIKANQDVWKKQGNAQAAALSWNDDIPSEVPQNANKVVLADCIYYREAIKPLIQTLVQLCSDNTQILLSQEIRDSDIQRDCWHYFLAEVERKLKISFISLEEQDKNYCSHDIVILKLAKI